MTDPKEPAFPRSYAADGHNGMTLRDYFAGQVLAGSMANAALLTKLTASEQSNAMLEARK